MSIQNFIRTSWEANIQTSLKKTHVFGSVANREYDGVINALGDKVEIIQIGDVTINAYTRRQTLTRQEMHDSVTELKADQAYYFDFDVNDVDAVQQKPQILTSTTDNAAYGFRDTVDSYLAGLYAQAGLTSYASGTEPWNVTSLNVEDVLGDIKEKMARVPKEGRFLICPEWTHYKMFQAGLTAKTSTDQMYANGFIERVMGFDILLSENVSASTGAPTWDSTKVMAGLRNVSYGFAEAILKVEAFRPEGGFEDAVKGLYVFGGKVLRPDTLCAAYVDKTAESA